MKRMWLCLLLALVLGVPAVPARAAESHCSGVTA